MEHRDRLYEMLAKISDPKDIEKLFEDLCTIREIRDLSQRFEVAEMLADGRSYQEISQKTGASTATICRVNKCLLYGTGGYRAAVTEEKKEETP